MDKSINKHTVPSQEEAIKFSDYAVGKFPHLQTISAVKKAIRKGKLMLDGNKTKTDTLLYGQEVISLDLESPEKEQLQLKLELEVLIEDEYLAIINKPAGIVVSGNKFRTIENALSFNLKKSSLPDALEQPQPIHRLDYPTSGLLLVGKTKKAVIHLNQMFEKKEVNKNYFAVTSGKMEKEGKIEFPVDEKNAISYYEVIKSIVSEKYQFLNLVKLKLETGRRHQLRIHLSHIGNPILGDRKYGLEGALLQGKGLFLHAYSLEFKHPFNDKKVFIEKSLPKKFRKLFPE